ncbi:hypothetical protein [Streptomyces triticiradicis]|uniref:hypothetical protein n=1 Tax=Streptomyces triticiradicis TaxID=2651189 RepID=UPI001CEC319B|nr:hypothetical protein [Streptomyces triticiradicis]
MRTSPGLLPRRATVGRSALATLRTPAGPASAPASTPADRPARARAGTLVSTWRHRALRHEGIARVTNSHFDRRSCARPAPPHGSGLLEPGREIRAGGDQLAFRIVSQRDAAWFEALFAAVDAKQ